MSWWWMGFGSLAHAVTPVGLPVPSVPGSWMRGEVELCVVADGKGRSLGPEVREIDDHLSFRCERSEKKIDRFCLVVDDVASWPTRWPESLSCAQGRNLYEVHVIEAYDPQRSYGETVWIRRQAGTPVALTWTLPEGPLREQGQAIRSDGRPWEGVRCEATGDWLSISVDPDARMDEGRCQFRNVSLPLRIEDVRL